MGIHDLHSSDTSGESKNPEPDWAHVGDSPNCVSPYWNYNIWRFLESPILRKNQDDLDDDHS